MKRSLVGVIVAALCLVPFVSGPALAHSDLTGSEPARGATLDRAPGEVRLEFNEPVEAEFDPVDVFDEEGNKVDGDDAGVDPEDQKVVTVGLADLEGGETYRVEYRVIAQDGDPTEGAYTFTLANDAAPAAGSGTGEGASGGQLPDAGGPGRLPLYAGLAIAGVLALVLVLDRGGRGSGAR